MTLFAKATHQQTKTYNSQLVLRTIYNEGQISRAEVARATQLTRATVSEVVRDWIEKGLVEEVGYAPLMGGGKTPILLSVAPNAYHLAAVYLDNHEFRGAVINLRGEILHQAVLPANGRDGNEALTILYTLLDALTEASGRPLLGIALGTPGLIDTINGVVCEAVNLGWKELPLGDLIRDRYRLPIYIANDSHLAALAEYMFGERPESGNLVVIKVEQGIGAGIVLKGQLFQGDGFGAGEIGHVMVVEAGEPCHCGHTGCLETVASDQAIVHRAQALASHESTSLLNSLVPDLALLTKEDVLHAYRQGDPVATQVVLDAGRALGIAVANLIGTLNIERVVLAGWSTRFGQVWLDAIAAEARRRALGVLADRTAIETSSLGPDVVVLGAAAVLLLQELGLSLTR